ncbi:DUF1217 domain-containing protein [Paracoccus aestuariivivens]|uniref:DUF1217 domain-containing protein n=1 Tax=Paracoccus aestuariivivens TaxID=1820333 RepID=A0A6L6J4H2_9RHOB|nr:DUF1217 domain-containing protein [Paracoccus aestuariivivens]MTH76105.1 DUF1217 domain-containing protein [Paracoccus aestuariivivens]
MTYSVNLASGGYTGWKLLMRTEELQRNTFGKSHDILRAKDYYQEKMPGVKSADQLVSDYRLLNVTLRAFGLEGDMNNRLFIKKVMEADPDDKSSLVNKLTDKRYLALNQALSSVGSEEFVEGGRIGEIVSRFEIRSFERSIGENYPEIEIALNAFRELGELSKKSSTENTKWYTAIASKPVRKFLEGALWLDESLSNLSIDRQISEMRVRLEKVTGNSNISQFSDVLTIDRMVTRYLVRSSFSQNRAMSSQGIALELIKG